MLLMKNIWEPGMKSIEMKKLHLWMVGLAPKLIMNLMMMEILEL